MTTNSPNNYCKNNVEFDFHVANRGLQPKTMYTSDNRSSLVVTQVQDVACQDNLLFEANVAYTLTFSARLQASVQCTAIVALPSCFPKAPRPLQTFGELRFAPASDVPSDESNTTMNTSSNTKRCYAPGSGGGGGAGDYTSPAAPSSGLTAIFEGVGGFAFCVLVLVLLFFGVKARVMGGGGGGGGSSMFSLFSSSKSASTLDEEMQWANKTDREKHLINTGQMTMGGMM